MNDNTGWPSQRGEPRFAWPALVAWLLGAALAAALIACALYRGGFW